MSKATKYLNQLKEKIEYHNRVHPLIPIKNVSISEDKEVIGEIENRQVKYSFSICVEKQTIAGIRVKLKMLQNQQNYNHIKNHYFDVLVSFEYLLSTESKLYFIIMDLCNLKKINSQNSNCYNNNKEGMRRDLKRYLTSKDAIFNNHFVVSRDSMFLRLYNTHPMKLTRSFDILKYDDGNNVKSLTYDVVYDSQFPVNNKRVYYFHPQDYYTFTDKEKEEIKSKRLIHMRNYSYNICLSDRYKNNLTKKIKSMGFTEVLFSYSVSFHDLIYAMKNRDKVRFVSYKYNIFFTYFFLNIFFVQKFMRRINLNNKEDLAKNYDIRALPDIDDVKDLLKIDIVDDLPLDTVRDYVQHGRNCQELPKSKVTMCAKLEIDLNPTHEPTITIEQIHNNLIDFNKDYDPSKFDCEIQKNKGTRAMLKDGIGCVDKIVAHESEYLDPESEFGGEGIEKIVELFDSAGSDFETVAKTYFKNLKVRHPTRYCEIVDKNLVSIVNGIYEGQDVKTYKKLHDAFTSKNC